MENYLPLFMEKYLPFTIYLEKNPAAYYSINIEKKIYKFIKGGWL
jgi:hypothetical protein